MLCERCSENEATVHLTQVIDGSVKKLHLCEDCAAAAGFDLQGPVSITDLLLGMGDEPDVMEEDAQPRHELVCSQCKMKRADFKKGGRLGCPACYHTFAEELSTLIRAVHRSEQHIGKVPATEGVRIRMSSEIAALQRELDEAITREHYEKAAEVRDRIKTCRDKLAVEEGDHDAH